MPLRIVKTIGTGVIVPAALALAGCGHWPGSSPAPEKPAPAEQPLPETEPAPDLAPEPEVPKQPDPGIAVGEETYDELYTALSAGQQSLAPEEVGYFIDVHEARLRQVLAGTSVQMRRVGGRLLLTIPGNLSFDTNSAKVAEAMRPVLDNIAAVLVEFDKTLVSVHGYTDDRGDAAYNRVLSERRAVAVALFLARNGVAKQRLVGIGYGEERPVIDSDTEAARTANRRIEILIEPVAGNRRTGAAYSG